MRQRRAGLSTPDWMLPPALFGSDIVTVLLHPDGDVRQFGPDVSDVLIPTIRQLLEKTDDLGASAFLDRNAEELPAGRQGTPECVRDDLDHL